MIEHPVPQHFTSYQFHLIGNMTIKQFLVLLAGAGIGFMFYSTNLPAIIKWPFVIIAVLTGIAIAFVPYEERTLDQWLVNFIRAMYRPTKFYWRRTARVPDFFTYTAADAANRAQAQPNLAPQRRQQVSQFLSSLQTAPQQAITDPLDMFDARSSEQSLNALFDSVAPAANVVPGETIDVPKPKLQTRARPLGETATTQSVVVKPSTPPPAKPKPEPVTSTFISPETILAAAPEPLPAAPAEPTTQVLAPRGNAETIDLKTVTVDAEVPIVPAVSPVAAQAQNGIVAPEEGSYIKASSATPKPAGPQTLPAIFDRNLPFPSAPTTPNMVIGMVHGPDHSILPGAIVEILDEMGTTVRAMKSNSLGQFYISTALPDGSYTIETDHDGHTFPAYTFTLAGTVLDPIDIQATE